jgi:hypothetical protein
MTNTTPPPAAPPPGPAGPHRYEGSAEDGEASVDVWRAADGISIWVEEEYRKEGQPLRCVDAMCWLPRDRAAALGHRLIALAVQDASGAADGAGPTEAELRQSIEAITDRSPDWDERNMLAVQRLSRAITELLVARPVSTAAGAFYDARRAEFAAYASDGGDWGERMSDAQSARQDAEDVLFAAVAATRGDDAWWEDDATAGEEDAATAGDDAGRGAAQETEGQ